MFVRISVKMIVLAGLLNALNAAEISQFRGSNGDGIAEGTIAPVEFSGEKNLTWKTAIPGKGWSSPVVADGKLWLTTAIEVFPTEEEREALLRKAGDDPKVFKQRGIAKAITLKLLRIDIASGKIEDEVKLVHVDEPNPIHKTNSYASPTPVIDGKNIFELFPDVQWYDYTKIPNRKVSHLSNYHLTWSYSAANPKYEQLFDQVISNGMSVAVVFRKPYQAKTWRGYKVGDGDKDDLRFLDPQGVIVGLKAKGDAKHDDTGFVVDVDDDEWLFWI